MAQGWVRILQDQIQGRGMRSRMEIQDYSGNAGDQYQQPKSEAVVQCPDGGLRKWASWGPGTGPAWSPGFWNWVLGPPSPAAAPGCGDGREAVFLHVQVPAGSQDLASPASTAAQIMPGPPQGPHLPRWVLVYLQQEVCEVGFHTAPNSPPFLPHPLIKALS